MENDIFARDLNGEMVSPNDAAYKELIADIFATMETLFSFNRANRRQKRGNPDSKEVKK